MFARTTRNQILTLMTAGLLAVPSLGAAWSEGDRLPDLSGYSLEGELPDLDGKVVLVDFWASWCGPCKASFPALNEINERFAGKDVVILAVNVDIDPAACAKFVRKMEPSFLVVRDTEQQLVAAAGVATMPSSYLVDRNGIIRKTHAGYQGTKTRDAYIAEIEALLAEGSEDES